MHLGRSPFSLGSSLASSLPRFFPECGSVLCLLEDSSRLSRTPPLHGRDGHPCSLVAVNSSSCPCKCRDGDGDDPTAGALGTAVPGVLLPAWPWGLLGMKPHSSSLLLVREGPAGHGEGQGSRVTSEGRTLSLSIPGSRSQLLPCTPPSPWGTAAINNSWNQAGKQP